MGMEIGRKLSEMIQREYRDVVAIYAAENIGYMAGIRQDRRGKLSLLWTDYVKGEDGELHHNLLNRLMIHGGNSEVVLCIGEEHLLNVARDMPGVTEDEVEQSIKLEMEYSGESCKWTYVRFDDLVTIKKLPLEEYRNIVDGYGGEIFVVGIMALDKQEDYDGSSGEEMRTVGTVGNLDWGGISREHITEEVRAVIYTACDYIRGRGYCFERVSDIFFRWNWLKIGALFLAINVLISVFICLGFFLKNQELAEESHGYKQQLALLENANDIKKEARELAVTSKTKAGILASLQDRGLGMSGYAVMVHLSHVPATGITLDEVRAKNNKELILKGKAENVGLLVKYISALGRELSIEKTQQGEQGNVEFICKGQL